MMSWYGLGDSGFGYKLYVTVFLGAKVSQQIGSPISATDLGNLNLVSSHIYFLDLIMAKLVWPFSSKPVVTSRPWHISFTKTLQLSGLQKFM